MNIDKLYALINKEEGERVCKGIDAQACKKAPRNYFLIMFSNMLTSLGDTLSNPKTVLAWLMNFVNAPVYLISFIVPIRESGSMLPQIAIASLVRKKEIRKWIYVIGSILQSAAIASIGWIGLHFKGQEAGWFMIIALVLFSLSRSLCSVASKDVLGKTIPKTRRGRLKGYTSSVSGILVLLAGVFMLVQSKKDQDVSFYSTIIFFAASLWLIAALIYAFIKEFPGDTRSDSNGLKEAFSKISLIKTNKNFRHFILARSLLLCSALSAPYYVLLAQEYLGNESFLLGLLIIANGVAAIISSPFWGTMADEGSHKVMAISGLMAAVLGLLLISITTFSQELRSQYWLYPTAFFFLGIAHSGVRLGRKTYIVDMANGNERTDYVATSNTLIGLILLITGGISALVSVFSVEGIILALSISGVLGAMVSARLPKVE